MTYVIAEPCIGTKDLSCVEVCPVDCIHPTPDEPDYDAVEMLYIDPEECIDCDACVEACPVDAIFAEDQLPERVAEVRADQRRLLQALITVGDRRADRIVSTRQRRLRYLAGGLIAASVGRRTGGDRRPCRVGRIDGAGARGRDPVPRRRRRISRTCSPTTTSRASW